MSKRRFSQEQYAMLLRCSEKRDVTEWNEWREANPDEEILMERAILVCAYLFGANLEDAILFGSDLRKADLRKADLSKADLRWANFTEARLWSANLMHANMYKAEFRAADLWGADLRYTNLCKADLSLASLWGAVLTYAFLERAIIVDSILCETNLNYTSLENADITGCLFCNVSTFDWKISGIICDFIYLDYANDIKIHYKNDKKKKKRQPEGRNFEPGEFERLYREIPTIEYIFENGMKWFDAVVMDQIAQEIQRDNPDSQLQLTSIDSKGVYPRAIFSTVSADQVQEFEKQITARYEEKIILLEEDRDRLYQVVMASASAPRQMNYAGRDLIQAGGDVTINLISPDILEKILEAVSSTSKEDFESTTKDEITEVVSDLKKEVMKEGAKYTAKAVWEKLKPLLPIILHETVRMLLRF